MKTINAIIKVLTALATVAGAVYIIATYGDQIVAWAKDVLAKCPAVSPASNVTATEPVADEATEETDAVAEEEFVAQEAVQETVAVEEDSPVADESDFEG